MIGREELAYLAGVVDSDGSINILRAAPRGTQKAPRHRLRVEVTQLTDEAIQLFQATFGGIVRREPPNILRRRPRAMWRWYVEDRRAVEALARLRPHLRIKRAQAWLGMEFRANWEMHQPLRPEDVALREGFALALQAAHHG